MTILAIENRSRAELAFATGRDDGRGRRDVTGEALHHHEVVEVLKYEGDMNIARE